THRRRHCLFAFGPGPSAFCHRPAAGDHRGPCVDWPERDDPQRRAYRPGRVYRTGRSCHQGCSSSRAGARESSADYWRSAMTPDRKLEWDWFPGRVPENVALDETAYLETTYSFELFRSRQPDALRIGRGASIYLGVMFDLGPGAHVRIGDF